MNDTPLKDLFYKDFNINPVNNKYNFNIHDLTIKQMIKDLLTRNLKKTYWIFQFYTQF